MPATARRRREKGLSGWAVRGCRPTDPYPSVRERWHPSSVEGQRALAKTEPKTPGYRLRHVAARLTRGGRRLRLRIDQHWSWATHLASAFTRCAALPQPAR